MSVIFTPSRAVRRRMHLWPLALFFLMLIVAGFALWRCWPQVVLHSALWQREVNLAMSRLLKQVAEEPTRTGGALLLFSFLYGVLHALGPGHGKIVITTWLATHPSRLASSLRLTFAASLLQGMVAIALVAVVLFVLQAPVRQLHQSGFWLEQGSYLLVGLLGLMLSLRAVRRLWRLWRPARFTAFTPHHVHSADCGCGHQHLPTPEQMRHEAGWQARLLVVLSMGVRPCSGAIMVLLFSKVIGVFGWGMASALAMAAGTSVTISAIALFVHGFRQLAVRLSGDKPPALWRQVGWATLGLAGGALLVLAAGVMWFSAVPTGQGLRPF